MNNNFESCICGQMPYFSNGIFGCYYCNKIPVTLPYSSPQEQINAWNKNILEEKESIIDGECKDITRKPIIVEDK